MTGVPRDIAEHRLKVNPSLTPIRQKKRHMALERSDWLCAEVDNLADGNWRMCVDFKDINKACPKDNYPLPKIDWKEVESAFQDMKKVLAKLPTLTVPTAGETLKLYLTASKEAVSSVVIADRGKTQVPVYFVSKTLTASEVNYSPIEKLVYALFHTARRLRRYFQAHPVVVLTDQPIKQVVELGEHEINFSPNIRIYLLTSAEHQDIPAPILTPWELYTDGAWSAAGSGAGIILTGSDGEEHTYALRFNSAVTNNEAEYETLLAAPAYAREFWLTYAHRHVV
ncbi:uncharacterized protein [Rutidosis leptorrhynchoides]|uniref:uncharacterized protein n=1 Tax=Rutidosis leptorrhynchoides TaxID=125765 RepID=UPI003A9A225E